VQNLVSFQHHLTLSRPRFHMLMMSYVLSKFVEVRFTHPGTKNRREIWLPLKIGQCKFNMLYHQ